MSEHRVLRYYARGFWLNIDEPIGSAMKDACNVVPAGSIVVVMGTSWLSRLIGWAYLLLHPWKILFGFRQKFSHTATYMGGDKIVDAYPKGVSWGTLSEHISKDNRVVVWKNDRITVAKLQVLRTFLDSVVGKEYGWLGSLSAVLPLGDDPRAYNCTEITVESNKKIKLFPEWMPDSGVYPGQIVDYLDSDKARKLGWRRCLEWS